MVVADGKSKGLEKWEDGGVKIEVAMVLVMGDGSHEVFK